MFTVEEANQLRDGLPEIDFETPASSDSVTQSYLKHYGLNFNSDKLDVTHYLGCFLSGQFKIACQYFALPIENQKATMVLVHGYYDHVGLYGHLIKHCLINGYSVLTFDLPGHGLSSGAAASIDNFDQYSDVLADCLEQANRHGITKPWYVTGQSTGAAILINYFLKAQQLSPVHFDKIIFLAPLLRPANWMRATLLYNLFRFFIKKTKRDFTPNSHDKEFSKFILEQDPLQTHFLAVGWVGSLKHFLADFADARKSEEVIHIVQGTKDSTVDWRYNLPKLLEKFPNGKTYLIDGAEHHMVNEVTEIREMIFAKMDTILEQ